MILALALTALAATGLSATRARADEWCGYATQKDAVVECGYMSSADCETAVGKGGMCFVDPDIALNTARTAPVLATPIIAAKLPPRG
jgi:hypothetical protein